MKLQLLLLCLLPVALCAHAPLQRVDLSVLKCDMQLLLDHLGREPTEQACETECHKLKIDGKVLNYGCSLVCREFIEHGIPSSTDTTDKKCGSGAHAVGK